MSGLRLAGIRKRYGDLEVLKGIDLEAGHGEFVVLVGPSGCGKSTLLRMIAGLESITSGELEVGGRRLTAVPPQKRNIAMVFQSYALFPHLSARRNISFGMELRGQSRSRIARAVERAASTLNLSEHLDRLPRELSGGQRQRVAMARALVREPSIHLMDEPLSNLDAQLRVRMRAEIKSLHERMGSTVVYVTHDQVEAMTLADRLVVMRAGRIEQEGRPLDLYDRPANTFVAEFLGSPSMNFIDARRVGGRLDVGLPDHTWALPGDWRGDPDVVLGIRPDACRLADGGIPGRIALVESTGAETVVHLDTDFGQVRVLRHDRLGAQRGGRACVDFDIRRANLFRRADGGAIPLDR